MTVAAIIQARYSSTRLPGKVLLPLAGAPMLARVVERVARIPGIDRVCVAVPDGAVHDPVAATAVGLDGVMVTRGDETDVLDRTLRAADLCGADTIMRVTSDCPFIDPDVSGAVLAAFRAGGVAYARTAFDSGYPHGFDTEVVAVSALHTAHREAGDDYEREHVTPFVWRRPERFGALYLDARPDRRAWRLVVDTPEDHAFAATLYDHLLPARADFGYDDIVALFDAHPDLRATACRATAQPLPGREKESAHG